jgi:hypothetical protein
MHQPRRRAVGVWLVKKGIGLVVHTPMYKEKTMINRKLWLGIMSIFLVFGLLFMGCSTTVAWNKVNLNVDKPPRSQIHNLKNETAGLDTGLQIQVEDIMMNFFDSRDEEYGYYTVNFDYTVANTFGGLALAYITGTTLFTTYLLGVPWTAYNCTLNTHLRIYDSNGNLVQAFQNSKRFILAQGLYYNNTPTRKAAKVYSQLLDDLLKLADRETRTINALLEIAGPISIEKIASARSNIRASEKI